MKPGEEAQEQQQHADHPVGLARLAEGTGEVGAEHVHDHRGHEQQRRPVVDLADEQPAADVEGDLQRALERPRHVDAAQVLEGPVVDDLFHGGVEEQREVGARQQQHDEAVERDLTEHERPVRREDLVELLPQAGGRVVALVELVEGVRSPSRWHPSLSVWSGNSRVVPPLPEGRADGLGEVAAGDEVSLVVHCNRKLGERPRGRTEDRPARTPWPGTATGGTGRGSGWSAPRTARWGSPGGCRSWRRRSSRRSGSSPGPSRCTTGWSGRRRISMTGVSEARRPWIRASSSSRSDSRNGNTVSMEPGAWSSGRTSDTSCGSPVSRRR